MSEVLLDLRKYGLEIIIEKIGDKEWAVDLKYVSDDGKYEEGEYLAGYNGLTSLREANFLAQIIINSYLLAVEMRAK